MSPTIPQACCWFIVVMTMVMPLRVAGFSRPDDCAVLPRAQMRVRLTLKAEDLPLAADRTVQVVTQVWRGEGLAIAWVPATDRPSWDGLDLWVHARRAPVVNAGHALGSVAFLHGVPQKFIQVSIDNTVDRVRRNLSQHLSIQPAAMSHLTFAGSADLVEQSLGYAIAHEIGHYVLALDSHASSGLMRADYDPVATILRKWRSMELDEKNRLRLRERLALGARCQ